MSKFSLIESFNRAIEGFLYVLKVERNMKVHFGMAFLVLIGALLLGFKLERFLLLLLTISLVFIAEIVNTVVEAILDIVDNTVNSRIKIIKDISAAGVLVSCLLAGVIGYLLFFPYISSPFNEVISFLKLSPWHITFIALLMVLALVILGKAFLHRGSPLRGGMPSGHSAVAFSIWTVTAFSQGDIMITGLVFILAFLIARSRVRYAVHTIWEVITGSLLGFLVTLMFYQLFLLN